ncbi:MAG: signal peptidase I [Candidatus Methanomethyliaceae archaeon]|nr:signal peptidase I [Candidatus Methanomethyliaceae archaeon]MDW7970820.1 signal peptidase I [Nitrososphaerota archaeon]
MLKNLDWGLLKNNKKFLIILLFFILTIGILRTISGTNMPITVVASGSMEPTVPTGSIVFIKKVQGYEILAGERPIGDIVVYKSPNTKIYDLFIVTIYDPPPILHRAIQKVEIGGKYYILTKGDANLYPDFNPNNPKSWISEDMIIGKLVWYLPYLGYPFLWLRNPLIMIGLIFFIIVIILIPREKNTKI